MFISYPSLERTRDFLLFGSKTRFFHKKLNFFQKLCYFYSIPSYFMLPYSV